jgi:6-phosphogluconolactonase (cycloisomerase 2 family)
MKFSKLSQLFLVSTIGLLVATLLASCEISSIDYLFVASSAGSGGGSDGQIQTYGVDSYSGAIHTADAIISSGGIAPVSMAVTSDYENLYVINKTSNTLVHFTIAMNGALTQKDAVTLSTQGTTPVSIAVNAANTYLYLVSADYPGPSGPLPGAALSVFPLTNGTIGTAVANGSLSYWPLSLPGYGSDLIVPTGVAVLPNNDAVYVTAYDQSAYNPGGSAPSLAHPGWVFGFSTGTGGVLTPAAGTLYQAGVKPTAIAIDPTSRFVYVTDYANNQMIGYTVQSDSTLNYLINGPFRTGNEPDAIVIDQRGKFIYVANALDSTVTGYEIDLSSGTPTVVTNGTNTTNITDTTPVAITIDAALGRFIYTANYLGNSVSGLRFNPTSGTTALTQASPYPTGSQPPAIISVPNGNHAVQSVTP